MASSGSAPGPQELTTDGLRGVVGLRWGVKSSFLRYLSRIPDADVFVAAGAGVDQAGQGFTFPVRKATQHTRDVLLAFDGQLQMHAHAGLLRVVITAPAIEVSAGRSWLTCGGPVGEQGRRSLARLSWPPVPGGGGWSVRAHLAEEAVSVFDGVYPAGEEMDTLYVDLATVRTP